LKKRRLNEKMGGGLSRTNIGINDAGPSDPRYKTKFPSGYHSGGYTGNADSQFSQRQSLISTLEEDNEEVEYKEDQNMLEEEETLYEFFARIAKLPLNENIEEIKESDCNIKEGHCSVHESSCSMSEKQCDESLRMEEEKELEEMSAGGVAGVAGRFGLFNADGSRTSKKQHSDRLDHAKKTYGGK